MEMRQYITYKRLNSSSKTQIKIGKVTSKNYLLNITDYEYTVEFLNGEMRTKMISQQHIGNGKFVIEVLKQ